MNLSNNIVSQFVKITNDYRKKEKQTETYGTVVIYNDEKYVQLDGSDLLTPVDSTVHVKDEERVTVTIKDHNAIITGNTSDISASHQQVLAIENDLVQFRVDAEGLFLQVKNEVDTKLSQFRVTQDGLFAEVNQRLSATETEIASLKLSSEGLMVNVEKRISATETEIANLKVTSSQISTEVSKKVDGTQIGTIVKQNATSWGLSINGKLSGTNYTFDGTNFTIGSSNGQTTAYHASGYSKWTHSDGSWTQVDSRGMTWSKGGTTSGYHCLLYAGEYTCDSESTVTITLPDEFKGKDFKVVTAIKRIYISETAHVTNCRFPLISFYAEGLNVNRTNGTFQIYASIRAWNRTGYSNWGTLIGNGSTAAERAALKPVVAYWAFV